MQPVLPLYSLRTQNLAWMLVYLVSIVAFIGVHEVILQSRFAEILNFFFVNGRLLLTYGDPGLIKVSFMIGGLRATGNQYWLTSRFGCFESDFGIGSSRRTLWIPLLQDQCMLLNQRRTYERGRCLLNRSFFAEKTLRVRVVLNRLRCIHLVYSEWLFADHCGCPCWRAGTIESELNINLSVLLMTLHSSKSIENLRRLAICVRYLLGDVPPDCPLCKWHLFESVGVESVWNEVLFRGFLGE